MSETSTGSEIFEKRLARLEQENKTLKIAVVMGLALAICGLVLAVTVAGGMGTSNGVLAKDQFGRLRAVLGTNPINASILSLGNDRGEAQAGLFVSADGKSGFTLGDAKGKPRVQIGVAQDGSAFLTMQDGGQATRLALGIKSDGEPGIEFFDAKGKLVMMAPPRNASAPKADRQEAPGKDESKEESGDQATSPENGPGE